MHTNVNSHVISLQSLRKILSPRFPILWLTVLVFAVVAAATRDVLVGGGFFAIVLPAVLFGQWCIRWLFRRFGAPVWLRRTVMLLPAFIFAFCLFRSTNDFGGRQTAAITVALAGHTPKGIRELHVQEDAWTDYLVFAYFRCDSASLRAILEQPPFTRSQYQSGVFSFAQTPFRDLHSHPALQGVIAFERTDLEKAKGSCTVYTDSTFSFAYITYGVD